MFYVSPGGPSLPHTIRFTETLYNQLQKLAKKYNLPLNSTVLQYCGFAIEHLGIYPEPDI